MIMKITNNVYGTMKTITKLFPLALLASATMVSCNGKVEPAAQDEKVAVQFGSSINATTRAVNDKWTSGDQIGIFMTGENKTLSESSIREEADNIAYRTEGNGAFSPVTAEQIIYFPMDGDVDFYAYYPYTAQVNDYRIALDLSDQSIQEALDLMYAKVRGRNKSNPKVELQFSHLLSNLILEVQPGTGLTQADLAELTVKVKDANTKATFNLVDGTISGEETPEGFTMKTVEAGKRYEALLFPTTSESREIEFDLNNDHDAPFTWTMKSALKGGSQYHHQVTLSRTAAEVSGSIKPWDNGGDNGEHIAK